MLYGEVGQVIGHYLSDRAIHKHLGLYKQFFRIVGMVIDKPSLPVKNKKQVGQCIDQRSDFGF